ncbi:MAG: type I DNA topoisomerase [Spirochaetes bacterium]|nr:type I DNA topoisomerase [Spirochaetota bacterium]
MAKNSTETLIIVESPAKAKTIERYLGRGYKVEASMGHLIDLPKSRMAIDIDHDFEPEYITVRGKAKILKNLVQKAKKSSRVLLASDNDREGEAIAYHIRNAIEKKNGNIDIRRIVFNEITPGAIKNAVKNPDSINLTKVNAQKARRILDRLVGYNLSPVLWEKVKNGLSAGRVQSVALRLICEREAEVEKFIPEEYWTVEGEFKKGKSLFLAKLVKWQGKKPEIKSNEDVAEIVNELKAVKDFIVSDIKISDKTIRPRAPFTTSTLQQAAANRLGFTSRRTMRIAQQLYEGINIASQRIGLITYMRTDSTRLSSAAVQDVRKFIAETFPGELPDKPVVYAAKKGAQDAHEAIRPTYTAKNPAKIKKYLTSEQFKLYSLIWERFVASQMKNARSLTTAVELSAGGAVFRVSATVIVEKGFQKALKLLAVKEKNKKLPVLKTGETVQCEKYHPEQHFTSGPSRYTDASIVKTMEELGIGRPSTYAPIISVLLDRYYVRRINKQLVPTQLGKIINGLLVKSFTGVINADFTATMEKQLDLVEEGKTDWHLMIRDFYFPFKKQVDYALETLESFKGVLDEKTEHTCELCGKPMVKKLGRYGFFLACSGFPECKNTKPLSLADCPIPGCTGKIVERRSRKGKGRGKLFYGCTNYPQCDFVTYYKPTNQECPKCGRFLVEKYDKQRGTYKSCINPDCDYLHTLEVEDQNA